MALLSKDALRKRIARLNQAHHVRAALIEQLKSYRNPTFAPSSTMKRTFKTQTSVRMAPTPKGRGTIGAAVSNNSKEESLTGLGKAFRAQAKVSFELGVESLYSKAQLQEIHKTLGDIRSGARKYGTLAAQGILAAHEDFDAELQSVLDELKYPHNLSAQGAAMAVERLRAFASDLQAAAQHYDSQDLKAASKAGAEAIASGQKFAQPRITVVD